MEKSGNNLAATVKAEKVLDRQTDELENASTFEKLALNSPTEKNEVDMQDNWRDKQDKECPSEESKLNTPPAEKLERETVDIQKEKQVESQNEMKSLEVGEIGEAESKKRTDDSKEGKNDEADSRETNKNLEEILYGGEEEPVFYGTEIPEMEAN